MHTYINHVAQISDAAQVNRHVEINCVRTRQEIGIHTVSIAYNMLYWTMPVYAVYIVHHSLHQDTS